MPASPAKLVKPPALRAGDTIGIIAPASNINRVDFEAGCDALRKVGYQLAYENSIFDRDVYFAGSLERRIAEFDEMFNRPDIRAVICARGGYGANYLLDKIDVEKIKSNPKIFVGYSDVTCLLTHLADAGIPTFHGPMVAKDWNHEAGVDLASWQSALSQSGPWDVQLNGDTHALIEGEAEGILYGGCLSILVASLGTPYEIQTEGKILFIEDIAAKPYQIDRMLMQLKLGDHLNKVRGLIFGEMLDCRQTVNQDYALEEVIKRIAGDLNIPVAYGLRSGHVSQKNITLPFGVAAKLSARKEGVSLKILEPAVAD